MRTMKTICLSLFLLAIAVPALAEPLDTDETLRSPTASAAAAPIRFFQRYLSPADGNRCPMTPSCSQYATDAIRRYGAVKGWIMTCDRLLRCGHDELTLSPSVATPDGTRTLDPIDNNNFWLR